MDLWNPDDQPDMKLPPCHAFTQFRVLDGKLHLQLYQRSCDHFLGVPYNITSYALLLHIVSHLTGIPAGEFVHTYGDLHLYENHMEQIATQLSRADDAYPSATLQIDGGVSKLEHLKASSFLIGGYKSHPRIKADVAV